MTMAGGIMMKTRTQRNIDYTLSTFAVEGLRPSGDTVKLYRRLEEGKLSLADAIKKVERKHNLTVVKRV